MVRLSEESGSVKFGRTVKTVRPYHKISTLKILILNLMPNKIETENQFKKLFGKIDSQIELTFLRTATYESKNTPKSYLLNHYKTLTEVSLDQFDGFIHFSTAAQVRVSAAKHRAGQDGLVLLSVDVGSLGGVLKWEESRGGALFPHLYGDLSVSAVVRVEPLLLDQNGHHMFPSSIS